MIRDDTSPQALQITVFKNEMAHKILVSLMGKNGKGAPKDAPFIFFWSCGNRPTQTK